MSTYCDPLILPRCVRCGTTATKPEHVDATGRCVDVYWCTDQVYRQQGY